MSTGESPPPIGESLEAQPLQVDVVGPAIETLASDAEVIDVPSKKPSSRALVALLVGVLAAAGWAGARFFASSTNQVAKPHVSTPRHDEVATVPASSALAPKVVAEVASAPAVVPASAPVTAKAAAAAPPTPVETATDARAGTGVLTTAGALLGRRIFVDKRMVGQTPASVKVACGLHVVQIGSSGRPSTIDVPCNGEINFTGR